MPPEAVTPATLQKIKFKSAGIACAVIWPLPWLTMPNPPICPQPFLGILQFSWIIVSYLILWAFWKREKQWLAKPALLALFIFLPDSLWLFNMFPLVQAGPSGTDPHWMDILILVQLAYFVTGYFVWKYFFKKIRPKDWNPDQFRNMTSNPSESQ